MISIENKIFDYIKETPRTRLQIIKYAKEYLFTGGSTTDKIIKGLLKNGMLTFVTVNKNKLYSVALDSRLQYVAEKIALYDPNAHRISKLAQYWNRFRIKGIVEDPEEISAEVKSFTTNNWYTSMIRLNGEVTCSCSGFMFYDVPCVHVLALAIKRNKIGWLP